MATMATKTKRQLSEQAVRLGCGYPSIWKAITQGELPAERCGGRWLVSDAAADNWREARQAQASQTGHGHAA